MNSSINSLIRIAHPDDLKDLVELDQKCRADYWTDSMWESELSNTQSNIWIYQENNCILAVLCGRMNAIEAELFLVIVSPANRRQGLGRRLLKHWIQSLQSTSVQTGTTTCEEVFLEVLATNQPAINLYLQVGFKVCGTRKNYYGEGRHASLLQLDLSC